MTAFPATFAELTPEQQADYQRGVESFVRNEQLGTGRPEFEAAGLVDSQLVWECLGVSDDIPFAGPSIYNAWRGPSNKQLFDDVMAQLARQSAAGWHW